MNPTLPAPGRALAPQRPALPCIGAQGRPRGGEILTGETMRYTTVINTGSTGRCHECRNLRHLYRKPKMGSRRLCAPCISAGLRRRAEVDDWLREVDAVVIQVQDLEAALEAMGHGERAVEVVTAEMMDVNHPWRCLPLDRAAHLARKAFGEVGR